MTEYLRRPEPLAPVSRLTVAIMGMFTGAVLLWRFTLEGAVNLGVLWLISLCVIFPIALYQIGMSRAIRERQQVGEEALLADFRRYPRRWRAVSICSGLLLSALIMPWPAALRFYVGWPWFTAHAARLSGPNAPRDWGNTARWIGLCRVDYVYGETGWVNFRVGRSSGDWYLLEYESAQGYFPWERDGGWVSPHWRLVRY